MANILVVGCGGIGSFLARELNRLLLNEQIDLDETTITLCDFDKVEIKNIKYQNFDKTDINKEKVKVLGERYCFDYLNHEITRAEQLKAFDFIISCVDNAKARKLIFEYCNNNNIYFIDLRAEGRALAIFTKHKKNTTEMLLKTLDLTNEESKSCQLPFELKQNIIQQGNVIVSIIASQLVLNKLRNIDNQAEYRYYI